MNALKSGVYVAMMTPWTDANEIDWPVVQSYVTGLCQTSITGLVVAGTTGEGMALKDHEFTELITRIVQWTDGKKHIMAGVSGITADQVLASIHKAQQAGAQSVLVLTPPYVRPSQKGLMAFFQHIHDHTSLPIVLYNNPGRTCVHLDVDTVCALSNHLRIVGIKDSTSDLTRPMMMRNGIKNPNFHIFSGEDSTFVPFIAAGGSGIISVQAGVVPGIYTDIWQALADQKWHMAQEYAKKLIPLHSAFSAATNPGPIKYATSLLGWGNDRTRFPLGPMNPLDQEAIAHVLKKLSMETYSFKSYLR